MIDEDSLVYNREEGCVVQVTVKPLESLIKEAGEKAFKEKAKNVSLPGFRKGRAPRSYIQKYFGQELLALQERHIAQVAINASLDKLQLFPHNNRDPVQYEWKEDTLTFSFETYPDVPTIDLKALKLKQPKKETLAKKAIEAAKAEKLEALATFEATKHKKLREGYRAHLRIEADGKTHEHTLLFKKEKLAAWLYDALAQLTVKKSLETATDRQEQIVVVHLDTIEAPVLPEWNDATAQKNGFEKAESWEKTIVDELTQAQEEAYFTTCASAISDALTKHYTFDVPKSLLKQELERRKKSDTPEEEAQRALRQSYLTYKWADQHAIEVKEDAVFQEIGPAFSVLSKTLKGKELEEQMRHLFGRAKMHLLTRNVMESMVKELGWIAE